MSEQLYYFRPGEERRMLARCQFGLLRDGRCGASLTYPIKGYPWRRNPWRSYEFEIESILAGVLFNEVAEMLQNHPTHCLPNEVLWSDHSEKANGITRDCETDTPCHTIGIYDCDWEPKYYYSMRENSEVLRSSRIFSTVMSLIEPYERLEQKRPAQQPTSCFLSDEATTTELPSGSQLNEIEDEIEIPKIKPD